MSFLDKVSNALQATTTTVVKGKGKGKGKGKADAPQPATPTPTPPPTPATLPPIAVRIQESQAAAIAANYPRATPEQVALASSTMATVCLPGGATDAFQGRIGSKAAGHNHMFFKLPKAILSKAEIEAAIEETTDSKGNKVARMFQDSKGSSEGVYNPNHMANLCTEPRSYGYPLVCRVPGGFCLNPLWLSASGLPLVNVEPPKAAPATPATGLDKAAKKAAKGKATK